MMESQYLTPLYLFCIVANEIVWTQGQGNVNFQLPGFGSLPSLQHRWYLLLATGVGGDQSAWQQVQFLYPLLASDWW